MKQCNLVKPSAEYKESFLAADEEYRLENNYNVQARITETVSFEDVLKELLETAAGINQKEGFPPTTEFWLVDGEEYIGSFTVTQGTVRQYSDSTFNGLEGGNVGYFLRPSKRGLGYGTEGLRLALRKAKGFGLKRALISTEPKNEAAKKIALKNGAIAVREDIGSYRIELDQIDPDFDH